MSQGYAWDRKDNLSKLGADSTEKPRSAVATPFLTSRGRKSLKTAQSNDQNVNITASIAMGANTMPALLSPLTQELAE